MTVGRRILAVLAVSVFLAAIPACNNSSTSSGPALTNNAGVLSVWYQDSAGPVAHLNVKFKTLSIYNTAGERVDLAPPETTVDLIAAKDNPTLLTTYFTIPVGDYNGVSGTVEIENFQVQGDSTFCTVANNELTIPHITVPGVALVVNEQGAALLIDIPVVNGDCNTDTQQGTLNFGAVSISPKS